MNESVLVYVSGTGEDDFTSFLVFTQNTEKAKEAVQELLDNHLYFEDMRDWEIAGAEDNYFLVKEDYTMTFETKNYLEGKVWF